jgi:hypothetical protein
MSQPQTTAPRTFSTGELAVIDRLCWLRAKQIAAEKRAEYVIAWNNPEDAVEYEREQFDRYYEELQILAGLIDPTPRFR